MQDSRPPGPDVAGTWATIDAIRRRNLAGAGKLTLTPALRKELAARLKEHSADDLAAMVEWVTGCACRAPKCRACSWLQPQGYTHPKTYLRPGNCSEYVDIVRQRSVPPPASATTSPTSTDPMEHHRRLVAILCSHDDRRMIEGDDDRHTLALRYAVKLCGGRDAFRVDPSAHAARWPEVWAAAEAEVVAKLAAMGQP